MSSVIYPAGFEQQASLLKTIFTKHTDDGATSALKPFLAQQSIDIAADAEAIDKAVVHEQSRVLASKQSQNNSELCDIAFEKVFVHIKSCIQFLKNYYKPDYKALGDWGVRVSNNGRLSYPSDIRERISLFNAMKAKHDSFAAGESPLSVYLCQNAIDLVADGDDAAKALAFHQEFQLSLKTAEYEKEQRDLLWAPVNNHIHAIGDYLKKLYSGNPKTMGLWGFIIDHSARQPMERMSMVKSGNKMTARA